MLKEDMLYYVVPNSFPIDSISPKLLENNIIIAEKSELEALLNQRFILLPDTLGFVIYVRLLFDYFKVTPKELYVVKSIQTAYILACSEFGMPLVPEVTLKNNPIANEAYVFEIGSPAFNRYQHFIFKQGNTLYSTNTPFTAPKCGGKEWTLHF